MIKALFIILIISTFGCSTTNYQKPKTTEQAIKPLKDGYIRRPILGVNVKYTNGHVNIVGADQNEGAGKAGLKSGDIIVAINRKPVRKRIDLINYLENKQIGEEVVVTIIRNRNKKDYIIKLMYNDFHQVFDALLRLLWEENKINLAITVGEINTALSMWPSEYEQWRNACRSQLITHHENGLLNAFRGEQNFTIIDRYQVENIFNEFKLNQAGFFSSDLRNKLIELLQATHLLIIEYSRFNYDDIETNRLIEIQTGKVIASVSYRSKWR